MDEGEECTHSAVDDYFESLTGMRQPGIRAFTWNSTVDWEGKSPDELKQLCGVLFEKLREVMDQQICAEGRITAQLDHIQRVTESNSAKIETLMEIAKRMDTD